MLEFDPLSEEDCLMLLPEGEYPFLVIDAAKNLSKAGNLSIKVTLEIEHPPGQFTKIYDYLSTKLMYKLKHFCDAAGLQDAYQEGKLDPQMCLGRQGKCKIKRDAGEGDYQPKNSVKDYCKPSIASLQSGNKAGTPDLDSSDIPF